MEALHVKRQRPVEICVSYEHATCNLDLMRDAVVMILGLLDLAFLLFNMIRSIIQSRENWYTVVAMYPANKSETCMCVHL